MAILSKIMQGISGRNVALFGWPMLAAGIGPDGNPKTLSVDTGGRVIMDGNIIVPDGVPITPPQAFVKAMATQTLGWQSTASMIGLQGAGIETINPDFLHILIRISTLYINWIGDDPIYDLSGNAISDPAEIDGILSTFIATFSNDFPPHSPATINISGGTNSPVMPVQAHRDEIFMLTLPETFVDGDGFGIVCSPGFLGVGFTFDAGNDLGTPVYHGSTSANLGIADNPSREAMGAAVAFFWNSIGIFGTAVDNGDGTVTFTDSEDDNYPYTLNAGAATFDELQVGQALIPNGYLSTLEDAGHTLITN